MTKTKTLAALIVIASLIGTGQALADAVTDWNAITAQTIATAGTANTPPRPGPTAILDYAMVHAAVYDAVQAIVKEYEPYGVEIPNATGSPEAAAAKAAHDMLVNRFPAQAADLDLAYTNYLGSHGLAADDPGVAVGAAAAAGIIALRAGDGSFPNPAPTFVGGTNPGQWRPTTSYINGGPPPSGAPMAAPWLGTVTPFTLDSPSQFRCPPPPGLTSGIYTRDYNEVKALGGDVNSERTQEQTDIAIFWAMNFLAQWNLALRDIAIAHVPAIGDSARLFALANLASADAIITVWESKRTYANWRPVTAIQEGGDDGNTKTRGDTNWRPFINTPNYPDIPSGANAFTRAMTSTLELFFGTDHFTFVMKSNNPAAVPNEREYTRFSDAARDVVNARIYQGIHFRFTDLAGRKVGRDVAHWTFHHALQPIHGTPVPEDEE